MGCMTKLFKLIAFSILIFLVVVFGPNTLPDKVTFTEFHVTPVKDLGKGYSPNQLLNNVERLYEEEIKGPEGFTVLHGELYTTLHGGFVVKVFDDQIIPVVRFGKSCDGWWEEKKCGRPLGIKAVGNEHLFVADAYYGIFKYNIINRNINKLVDKDIIIDGREVKTFNALDVASDGTVYYTHSSSDFTLDDGLFIFLADGSARLIKYDPNTKTNTVLLGGLFFANGVLLSPNEDFILVSESGHSRILKHHLKGPKKFTTEIFIDGLPGIPDNLRAVGEDRLFVSLFTTRSESFPAPFQFITNLPMLRKFLARSLSLIQLLIKKIHTIYPNDYTKKSLHYVGHIESLTWSLPSNVTLLEMNWKGEVVRSYHGDDGTFSTLSDVMVHDGYLYLGSPINEYLGRVPLTKLGEKIPVKKPESVWDDSRPPTQKPTAPPHHTSPLPTPKQTTPPPKLPKTPPPTKPSAAQTASPTTTTPKPPARPTNSPPTGQPKQAPASREQSASSKQNQRV